jgi:hypothetical protein
MNDKLPAANAENADLVRKAHFVIARRPHHQLHFIDPANTTLVRLLHTATWHDVYTFQYRTSLAGQVLVFEGTFLDRAHYQVLSNTPAEVLRTYPRGKALVSLIHDRCFPGVEAFAVACQNALGDDVDSVLLAGKLFF